MVHKVFRLNTPQETDAPQVYLLVTPTCGRIHQLICGKQPGEHLTDTGEAEVSHSPWVLSLLLLVQLHTSDMSDRQVTDHLTCTRFTSCSRQTKHVCPHECGTRLERQYCLTVSQSECPPIWLTVCPNDSLSVCLSVWWLSVSLDLDFCSSSVSRLLRPAACCTTQMCVFISGSTGFPRTRVTHSVSMFSALTFTPSTCTAIL